MAAQARGEATQPDRRRAEGECPQQRRRQFGIGGGAHQQILEPRIPLIAEQGLARRAVQQVEGKRQAGLERMRSEQPTAEGVDRLHRSAIEVGEGRLAALTLGGVGVVVGDQPLQRVADTVTEFGCGRLSERDRGDAERAGATGREHAHDAIDERSCLAGPRAGFDEERPVQSVGDRVALCLVDEGVVHHSSPSSSPAVASMPLSAANGASAGSVSLCSCSCSRARLVLHTAS